MLGPKLEFDFNTASSDVLKECLSQYGVVIIRNCAYAEDTEELFKRADTAFKKIKGAVLRLGDIEDPEDPYFSPVRLLRENPLFDTLLPDLQSETNRSIILSMWNSVYRRLTARLPISHAQFWQDQCAGITGVSHTSVWLSLNGQAEDCGYGVEWLANAHSVFLTVQSKPSVKGAPWIEPKEIEKLMDKDSFILRPTLEPGDMVLYDSKTPLRRYHEAGGRKPVYSCNLITWHKTRRIIQEFALPDFAAWFELSNDKFFGPIQAMELFHDDGRPKWQLGDIDPDKLPPWSND
ncbi:MAG: hypothetical protein CMM44_07565 [Rhodospirillaceae bacterium]|nr:hypothetical protein [Rhodospirillaceae bacterium]|tara:strand:- start:2312 stop:3187 length:876 start_codon:yes stop_codon:yes gene_type:complete